MKRIKLFIVVLISLFVVNVKADMAPPSIVSHKVMVTNKEGAICYEDGKKTDKVIPYGTTLQVDMDIEGSYIDVYNNDYNCSVKYSDVSSKTQSFDLNTEGVEKITPMKAIILANGGLNLRKGPSVTYSKLVTIPQYTVVTVTHRAGTYWYYTEYNGTKGWITAMEKYVGFDNDKVFISYQKTNIYDSTGKKILGTIPANTEITDYIHVYTHIGDELGYYVIYNGIKGYIDYSMLNKIDSPGKIKLTKDYDLYDSQGNKTKKLTAGQELEYTMVDSHYSNGFYVPDKNITLSLLNDDFEYITKANISIKKTGYIGEGLFGEKKEEKSEVTPTPESTEPTKEENKNKDTNGMSTRDIIIICLLGGIFLALTAIVIIKLVNGKKKESVIVEKKISNEIPKEEIKEDNHNDNL